MLYGKFSKAPHWEESEHGSSHVKSLKQGRIPLIGKCEEVRGLFLCWSRLPHNMDGFNIGTIMDLPSHHLKN